MYGTWAIESLYGLHIGGTHGEDRTSVDVDVRWALWTSYTISCGSPVKEYISHTHPDVYAFPRRVLLFLLLFFFDARAYDTSDARVAELHSMPPCAV